MQKMGVSVENKRVLWSSADKTAVAEEEKLKDPSEYCENDEAGSGEEQKDMTGLVNWSWEEIWQANRTKAETRLHIVTDNKA